MKVNKKQQIEQKRIWRIRKKIKGTQNRPRLCVHFSNKHIYAQAIDDEAGRTLLSLSTLSKEIQEKKITNNVAGAKEIGKIFGEKAKEKGINVVVFDRNGRLYHGAVKAFAEASREAELKF